MANIFKAAFYIVDPNSWYYRDCIEQDILHQFRDADVHQLHVEEGEMFYMGDDSPERFPNCDLADLEKHFNHENVAGEVVVGGVYKHFKGHEVKVLAVSIGTEYGEKVVVYEHLGDHTVWHRPIGMFCSLVDREKYPDAEQKHRFELISQQP